MVSILRLINLLNLFSSNDKLNGFYTSSMHIKKQRIYWKLFEIICIILLFLHCISCLWYYIGKTEYYDNNPSWIDQNNANIIDTIDNNVNTQTKYINSLYFTVILFSTVGMSINSINLLIY